MNNNMTWRQLKDFLNQESSDTNIPWDKPVLIQNMETDDVYTCDTLLINSQLVLAFNLE